MWPFSKKTEQRSLTQIEGYWPDFSDGAMALGHVSVSRAMALVPVFGAIRLIADSVASLPLNLYGPPDDRGVSQRQPTPSLFANPSIHGTLHDWLFRGTAGMAGYGDAIGLVTARDYYNYPTMVEWLNPEQVATQDGKLYGPGSFMNPLWWWYGRPIDPRDLVHIPWFTMPYKVRGLSPVGAFQLTANVGIGAEEYAANWYGNGGVPPGTFRNTNRTFDEKDADKMTARITARLQSRKPLVYGSDWEYNPIAIKPHEALFVETMRLTATQIAVIYGVPPDKIGGSTGDSLTYATVEQNTIDYLTFSLRAWLVRWEQALTALFPRGYYAKFDEADFIRLDAKTRAEIDAISLGFNPPAWMEVDEVRANRNLPPSTKLNKLEVPPPQPALPNKPGQQQLKAPSTNGQPMMRDRVNGNGSSKISNNNHALSGSTPTGAKGN
jgi:HK97 family phage portal protein